ncbi:MAG: hypothetical protein NUV31_07205 [Dehalococcoidales bacterium]|nr:hypothetical protein [Dehalococcoidales bacterium]
MAYLVWLELAICILIIFFFGRRVAIYGDIIAEKTRLGGLWIGLVLISITTSLPELFNGVSSIYIVDAPDLTVGNLLGANTFNLFNLALLDMVSRSGSIMPAVGKGQKLAGWYGIILVALIAIPLLFHSLADIRLGWLGWTTPIIILIYLFSIRQIFLSEKKNPAVINDQSKYEVHSLQRTFILFSISALFIIGAGIWLATIGEDISRITGLGESFVGSILISFTTTLPEITVSFSALRLGAVDMAMSNMLGSNMFNMFLICFDDILYTKGPILSAVSSGNLITALTIIVLTLITLAGLYFKPRRFFRLSWYNLLIFGVFITGAYLNFLASR